LYPLKVSGPESGLVDVSRNSVQALLYWSEIFPDALNYKIKFYKNVNTITWDVEPYYNHCYCPLCRKGFAKQYNLANTPTVDELSSKYGKKWAEYRVIMHNKVIVNFSNSIKKHNLNFKLCTNELTRFPGGKAGPTGGLVDPRLLTPEQSLATYIMSYYAGTKFYDDTKMHMEQLKNKIITMIDPTENDLNYAKRYTPDTILQNIIASASLKTAGFGFWPGDDFDGRYLTAIHDAFRIVAKAEPFYLQGHRNDNAINISIKKLFHKILSDEGKKIELSVPSNGNFRYNVYKKNGSYLITMFNYDGKTKLPVRIALPQSVSGKFAVLDLAKGTQYTNKSNKPFLTTELRNGFNCIIPPNGFKVIELRKGDSSVIMPRRISQAIISQKFKIILKSFAGLNNFPAFSKDNAAISWGDIDNDNFPDIILEAGNKKVYVSLNKNGTIIGWKNRKIGGNDFLFFQSRGDLDYLRLHPNWTRKLQMKLKQARIVDGCPEIILEYKIPPLNLAVAIFDPLEGLVIRKKIILSKDGKKVSATVTLINNNSHKKSITAGLRIKCYPRLGGRFAGDKGLPSIFSLLVVTDKGEKTFTGASLKSSTPYNFFCLKGKNVSTYIKQIPGKSENEISNTKVILSAKDGTLKDSIELIGDSGNTAGLFVFYNSNACTVELLSDYLNLGFGKTFNYNYKVRLLE